MEMGKVFVVGNLVMHVTALNVYAQRVYFWEYILRRYNVR